MSYQVGQKLKGGVARVREAKTEPPDRFTEGTLIAAMTNIDRFVPNEADRKVLRDTKGIGTERTRDSMIEKLKQVKYMVSKPSGKGKKRVEIHPTDLGMELIAGLPRELSDPVTTAKWEMALGLIEKGSMTKQQFGAMIRANTTKLVDALRGVRFDVEKLGVKVLDDSGGAKGGEAKARPEIDASVPGHGTTCEKCKKGRMEGKRFSTGKKVLGCTNYPSCKHSKWID